MTRSQNAATSQGQIGSLLISSFFVLTGVIALWDTTNYTDRDSQVFPQTVAVILIVTALASVVMRLVRPSNRGGFGEGIWWRRILIVAAMFGTAFAIPVIGFLGAGMLTFAGGLVAAMHDRWTARTAGLYLGSAMLIMIGFFSLFKYVLHVPLP